MVTIFLTQAIRHIVYENLQHLNGFAKWNTGISTTLVAEYTAIWGVGRFEAAEEMLIIKPFFFPNIPGRINLVI